MIRARRLAQYAAAAASPSASSVASSSSVAARTVLVRRLHAAPSVVRAVARPTIFAAPRSRFSPLHNGALATATTRRISLPSAQQIRWRSALTDAQQDQLSQRLEELATCRDNGNWRQALKLLDQMDKEGFALDADMYEMAIAACARMGKIEVLPGLLQNMEVDSLLPTNRTIDFIMQAYIAAEEWKLIVKLAKEVTSKGVVLSDAAFQAAFESCGKMRDATSARQIVLNAEHAGASELDAAHYAAAIRACGMGGRADIAASLFSHMEEKRGLVADADVFNHLIRSQIVNGAMPQALQTFSMVNERPDVVMPESIYTATIDALVSQGEFWQASQLFGQMLAHKLSPSVFCYGRMMVAYVRLNKHELAHECWERILAIDEPSPNLTKYAKMVSQLATTNDSELAVAIFEHIFPRFDPTQIRDTTYAAAIRAYGRLGRTETALNLFDTFVASRQRVGRPLPRSAGIYLAVFNALSRDSDRDPQQNTRDAKRVWDIMVESVPVVLAPAYASLAGVLASSGDLTTLQELMDHAEESLAQQQDHYARRRRRHTGAMRADQGFNAYDEMMSDEDEDEDAAFDVYEPSGKMTPSWRDELLFNGVISGFSKARSDQSQRVMDYLELMRSRGMTINDSVIRAATDTFVKNEQWQLMYDLMEYVDVRSLQNADVCFGDTISKLLDAGAWEPARFWISRAHRMDVQPPIRGKMEVLRQLSETQSQEWQIAYALARETLSFKQMVQENVESVADAIDVCLAAQRMDLVIKLYERTATHPSVVRAHRDTKIPLRMFKATLLACMREHSTTPDFGDAELTPIQKAEQFCAHMLQMYGGRKGKDVLDGDALSLAISIKATMGDDDDVLALFEKMQQHGFEPNSYACNAAIMAYSRARKINKVLAVRDGLLATNSSVLKEPKITQSLLFSVAILNDDQQVARLMAEMRHMLPHVTSDLVISAFLQANRLDKCVEFFDADCSLDLFHSCVRRILDAPSRHVEKQPEPVDVVLSAQLLLKYIALHGLDQLKPPGVLLRIAKRQIKAGNFREALAIIDLYDDPRSEVSLTDMKPTFQTEVLEMRLFLHGEQQSYDLLLEMFEKQAKSASSAPLTDRHYQLAMEYCNALPATVDAHGNKLTKKQQQERLVDGALASLKLFEMLRLQFIKPTGPVYVLALQSCHKLGRLDVTGARVLQDAVAQGFTYELGSELFRLANIGVNERQRALASDATDAVKRRDRKSTRKPEGNFAVNASHLASIALFAHHNGVRMPWKLARKLLEMESELSVDVKNEIEYIKAAAEAAYESAQASGEIARKTPKEATYTERKPRATKAAPGSRWGELYLQKHE